MVSLSISTQITAVTVYTDRALVTRQGTIELTGTERELILTQLPPTLDPESVRVSGKGRVAVKLQGVTTDRQYAVEPVGERIAELTTEIDRLEADKRHLQYQINTIALQSSFIYGLREKTETTFSRSLASQQIGLEDTQNFLNFIGTKNSEYALATEDLQHQQRQIDKRLKSLQLQLREVQTPYSKESLELRVSIEPAGAGEFQLEVVYMVDRASWTPLYDLRFQKANNPLPFAPNVRHLSDTIQLNYLAEITQTTGEDWSNVSLILSTAKPGLGALPPKLDPWYIDAPKPAQMDWMMQENERGLSVAAAAPMMARARVGGSIESAAEDIPTMNYAAETVIAEVSQQGSVVTFQLAWWRQYSQRWQSA